LRTSCYSPFPLDDLINRNSFLGNKKAKLPPRQPGFPRNSSNIAPLLAIGVAVFRCLPYFTIMGVMSREQGWTFHSWLTLGFRVDAWLENAVSLPLRGRGHGDEHEALARPRPFSHQPL